MLVTKTPLRLTLGGGGTDLRTYYSDFEGFVVTTAVDKYVYVGINEMFEKKIRLSYSKTEIVDRVEQLQHPVVREALRLLNISRSVEIVSIADLPSNTGLGSSGSFAVGLLHGLHLYNGESVERERFAEEACDIQMEILKEPEGKQDPYIAALGGVISLTIDRKGIVNASPIGVSDDTLNELQNSLLFFYTGIKRPSSLVLREQQDAVKKENSGVVDSLHRIKEIGYQVRSALEKGDVAEFGRLQHEHWLAKRSLTPTVSSDQIDTWYKTGMEAGALGGKVLGAGGGGFLMFCCQGNKERVRKAMTREGLREVTFRLGVEGTRAALNL